MDDLALVEIMEAEAGKLSPEAKEVWEAAEGAAELNEQGSPEFMATLPDLARRRDALSAGERAAVSRLIKLAKERKDANDLEETCSEGWFAREWRRRAVVDVARRKDRQEGCPVDLDMTVEDAVRTLVGDI